MVDAGSAVREAREQRELATQYRGSLSERVNQLNGSEATTDDERMARIRPVIERLFAAAAPWCGGQPCYRPVTLEENQGLNAHADSQRISISRTMVDLARSDEQLALVLGHELAHVLMGHIHRDFGERVAALFGQDLRKDDERQADYVGLYLVARAGYSPTEAVSLWRRMGAVQPAIIHGDKVHPGTAERFVALRDTAAEIADKKRRGLVLMPNTRG
jgi:predicted Zn-dependent protease